MKALLSRDIPWGAALAIVALVLAASVVTGRDEAAPGVIAVVAPAPALTPLPSSEEIPIDLLKRNRREGEVADLFASPQQAVPPITRMAAVVSLSAPPPAPSAPPLPFRYLGRMSDGDSLIVFLARGNDALTVRVGETVDGNWRLDEAGESTLRFTYLPLKLAQPLAIPALP